MKYHVYLFKVYGMIIYVGVTARPYSRYAEHLNQALQNNTKPLYRYMYRCLLFGHLPEFKIIKSADNLYEARQLEREAIVKHKPTYNAHENGIIPATWRSGRKIAPDTLLSIKAKVKARRAELKQLNWHNSAKGINKHF